MDEHTKLARKSIEHFLKEGSVLKTPTGLSQKLTKERAGVFVSLHQKTSGELRGCIGTFSPVRNNIAQEIIHNAIASATEDPRFPAVSLKELQELEISVDVLSSPKNVIQINMLDTKKHGLIVSTPDGRRGLLLPDIEGIDTVCDQEKICRLKGGIGSSEPVAYQYFTVTRHEE